MSNRLIHETSPYLLQHAHNPVDWYPWGEEALQKAHDENKPILVSIGYSACHWCHVMERESFENAETAAVMNRNFVNIKIDREERPDLDQVYMDAVQTLTGSGGWPLNVFLTPDGKPFYGGTYFPPVQAYNRNSWRQTLAAVHDAWQSKPEEIRSQAENLTDHLSKAGLVSIPKEEAIFSEDDLQSITNNLLKNADTTWGGFGRAPKFPQTFSIQFLLRQFYHDQKAKGIVASLPGENEEGLRQSAAVKQALLSLDKMIMGGIYDQLQGGFARYSTDAHWLAPHFEKMLYDNALLVSVMSEAYQLTGREIYKTAIEETMQFVKDEWQDDDGGVFSAYDADSEGEEGKYYTWQASEIDALITDKQHCEVFKAYYGITEEGNWEHTNILWIRETLQEFCLSRQLDEASTRLVIGSCRKILLEARSGRPKPLLDDKKLMGWNALMITACCKAWAALGNDEYLAMAENAYRFVENNLHKEGIYSHNYKNGKAANPAFLDDYSNYIYGLIHLQEITGNTQFLQKARVLTELVLREFGDEETSFFFYTSANQKDIIFRKIDVYDGATSSGNSVMAYNLFYLGIVFDEPAWKAKAIGMVNAMKKLALNYPTSFSIWGQLLQWIVYGVNEIAVIGKTRAGNSQVLHYFIPNKVVQTATETNDDFPLLSGKNVPAADFIIYICQQFQCKQPVFELKKALNIVV